MRFMNKEEALMTMSLFGITAETQCIDESSFREWMVRPPVLDCTCFVLFCRVMRMTYFEVELLFDP